MYRNRFDGVSKCLEVSNLEDFENLNSNLLFVFEKITSDKDLAENFSKCKTGDELYNFCLKIKDGYSREEWEEFIEILYILTCDEKNVKVALSNDLDQISGGIMSDKMKKKFLAGTLAVLSFMPATSTFNPEVSAAESGVLSTSTSKVSAVRSKISSIFSSNSKNVKRLKKIILGVEIAVVTVAIGVYLYKKMGPTIKSKFGQYDLKNGDGKGSQHDGETGGDQEAVLESELDQSTAGAPGVQNGASAAKSAKKLKEDVSDSQGSSKSSGTQQVVLESESGQNTAETPGVQNGASAAKPAKKLKEDVSDSQDASKSDGTKHMTPGSGSDQSTVGASAAQPEVSAIQSGEKLKKDVSSSKDIDKSGGTKHMTPGSGSDQSTAEAPAAQLEVSATQTVGETDDVQPNPPSEDRVPTAAKAPLASSLPDENAPPNGLPNFGHSCYLNALTQLLVRADLFNELSKAKANGAKLSPQANACLTIKEAITGTREVSRSELYKAACDLGYRDGGRQEDIGEIIMTRINSVFEEAGMQPVISNPVNLPNLSGRYFTMKDILEHGGGVDVTKQRDEVRKLYGNLSDKDAGKMIEQLPLLINWKCSSRLNINPLNGYFAVSINRITDTKVPIVANVDGLQSSVGEVSIPGKSYIPVDYDLPGYECLGVAVHIGDTINSGHYVAYIKRGSNWYLCDDRNVKPVSYNQVQNGVYCDDGRFIPGANQSGVLCIYRQL
mgnify:CR=1 FL=1